MASQTNARSGSGKGAQLGHHDDTCDVDFRHIGHNTPLPAFINLVEAALDNAPHRGIAAGRIDATAPPSGPKDPASADIELFWTYTAGSGLHLEVREGFLNTATGNGGSAWMCSRMGPGG